MIGDLLLGFGCSVFVVQFCFPFKIQDTVVFIFKVTLNVIKPMFLAGFLSISE